MKILAVQNRMGVGDMVIFLPFIETISKNFGVPVSMWLCMCLFLHAANDNAAMKENERNKSERERSR